MTWYLGLNFQIEHHLFPIRHVHYPASREIVQAVSAESAHYTAHDGFSVPFRTGAGFRAWTPARGKPSIRRAKSEATRVTGPESVELLDGGEHAYPRMPFPSRRRGGVHLRCVRRAFQALESSSSTRLALAASRG